MTKKKGFMIIILTVFLVFLCWVIININESSTSKISSKNQTNMQDANQIATNTSVKQNSSVAANQIAGITNNISNKEIVANTIKESTGNTKNTDGKIDIKITDNYFIEQTNDIYLNLEDYIGKTISLEGLVYTYGSENFLNYAVVRNTPGCCGNDGLAGLDIRYNGTYPDVNTWVEAKGVLEKELMGETYIPVIKITSLTPKQEGKTFVSY